MADRGSNEDCRPDPALVLGADRRGVGERLILVHGFTQNSHCWGPIADDLAPDHELVLIDAPGHGGSGAVAVSFEAGAGIIGDAGGAGTYVGYSMGGRYCLRLALDHPEKVDRLVLIGTSPGLADPDERSARRQADHDLADRVESIGVAAFLDEWLALPLFEHLEPAMQFVDERRHNNAAGLASSLRLAGTAAQEPLWDRLGTLAMPVLLVTGALDTKFAAIAAQMAEALGPNATLASIPAAGHTAHLEQPDAFVTALRAWLASHPTPPVRA